ncbi:MAG: hypothetical protein R2774_07645 [Saprospiraceae bacterium]
MRKFFIFMPMFILGMTVFYQSCNDQNSSFDLEQAVSLRGDRNNFGNGFNSNIPDWETRFNIANPYRNQLTEIISITFCRKPILKKAFKISTQEFKSTFNTSEDEFLFNVQKDKPISVLDGKSISQTLIEAVPEKPVAEILDFLCKNDPGLAILCEGNLASSETSDEVFIDENFDDSSLENSIFEYFCGKRIEMKLKDAEFNKELIFIVRESEAYSPDFRLGNSIVETISLGTYCNNDIILIGNSMNEPDTDPNGNDTDPNGNDNDPNDNDNDPNDNEETDIRNNPCPSAWRSIQNGKENLYRYKTDNDYDPCRGNGEFLEYVLYGKELKYKYNDETGKVEITGAVTDYVQKRQESVKDNFAWKVVNADLFRWEPENNGYRYKILWYEDDKGKAKPIIDKITLVAKVKLPDGTAAEGQAIFDFNRLPSWLTNGDDFIGENIIDYCDPELFDYTPNSIDVTVFNVNER